MAAAGLCALGLSGCASGDKCGLSACGVQAMDLLKVSADQLSTPSAELKVYDIRTYPEATVVWRVNKAGRQYQCREKRDEAAPDHIHFVYCRPAT
jgi:hypothetical protein